MHTPLVFMMGFSFLMSITMLFKSALNGWERANLYCALLFISCFFNCLLFSVNFDLGHYGFNSDGTMQSTPGLWFNHLTPTFLLLLHREFLNIKNDSLRFYKFLTACIRIIILSIVVEVIFTFSPNHRLVFDAAIKVFQSTLFIAFLVLPFYAIRFWRHPIYRFAAWSSWSIIFFYSSFLTLSFTGWEKHFPQWFIDSMLFTILIVDGILFIMALTLRDRQVAIENMRLQQQATTNELKALRAQMNPHFIFNALNSIKSFNLNHDTEGANFYLTKFSKLIRQVLDNSRNEKITLKSELETLVLYLDMENMRIGDKFDYHINIDTEVETDFVEIPPMLIQPYIENAIWHGLVHKEGQGNIQIDIQSKNDTHLIINILDNGIGREKAAALKSKTGTIHKSFGMKITAERLDIIKQLYNIEAKINFEDLKNANGSAAGTKVTLEIPI